MRGTDKSSAGRYARQQTDRNIARDGFKIAKERANGK